MKKFVLTAAVAVSFYCTAARADVPAARPASLQAIKGRIVTDAGGTLTAEDAVTLSIGPAPPAPTASRPRCNWPSGAKRPATGG